MKLRIKKLLMNSNPILLLIVGLFAFPSLVQAQKPTVPTPVEFMVGHNRLFFQMVVKKKFTPESKFGFLSVTSFSTDYSNELNELDLVMPVLLTYNVYKNFGLVAGTTINNKIGFAPLAGIEHSFANREWVAVTIASLFLNSSRNVELLGIYEYKPRLSDTFDLYSRLQYLYIHGVSANQHARSFLQLRAGLKKNALNFGLGANLDQYGPEKEFKPNYGIFVGWAFQ